MTSKINAKNLFLLLGLLLLSCSDYEISKIPEDPEPDIDVAPLAIDYGTIFSGHDVGSEDITITNVGTDVLDIDAIGLMVGDTTFSVQTGYDTKLDPGESTEVTVEYTPVTYSANIDKIRIYSNDPDEPFVDIELAGVGDAPVIDITPEFYSFPGIYVGCNDYVTVTISNLGSIDLEINDIEHFASLPADFELYDYEPYYGMLPIVVAPGDSVVLEVLYEPSDGFDDSGFIQVHSNDPLTPIAYSDQVGDGDYEKWVTDEFDQDDTVDVDILFVIDNSGSMGSNQTNFKSNFSSFMSVFSAAGVDYRIAFITTDQEEFVLGKIVTPADSDPVAEVNTIVDNIGTRGSATEKGLYYSYLSTTAGEPAGPGGEFFRSDAKLVIIYVSDEPDHSSSSSGMVESDYVSHFRSLKATTNLVIAHAVAGDYPSGCTSNGGAQFGDGYYGVVNSLGGSFLSICASDWGVAMDTLARESVMQSSFVLTEHAVDGTIEVMVDGTISSDWYFDVATNSVVFSTTPPSGSKISVTYAVWSCEE